MRLRRNRRPKHWSNIAPSWEGLYVHRQADLFLSVFADDKNMAGRRTSLAPIWLKLKRSIDLEEPAPLVDQVYSGYTQRESVTVESNVKTKGNLFAKITTTETDVKSNMKDVDKIRVASWSCDMKGHAENAWNVIAIWRANPWISCEKFQPPIWMMSNSHNRISREWVNWPMYVLTL